MEILDFKEAKRKRDLSKRIDFLYPPTATPSEQHMDLVTLLKLEPFGLRISAPKFYKRMEAEGLIFKEVVKGKVCRCFTGKAERYGFPYGTTSGQSFPYTAHIYLDKIQVFIEDVKHLFRT